MAILTSPPIAAAVVETEAFSTNSNASSGVSWGAVLGGAATGAVVSLLLLMLGAGIGLSAVSPWAGTGATASAVGVGAAIWLVVMQWLSAGLGGYLTGRLRVKWSGIRSHEAFFRDTANGFLSWAIATLVGAGLLTSAVSGILGTGANAVAGVASSAAQGTAQSGITDPTAYFVDSLFRAPAQSVNAAAPAAMPATPELRGEVARILATGLRDGDVSPADRAYLAQMAAARTGIAQDEAERRVAGMIDQAKAAAAKAATAADEARKVGATLSYLSFFALMIGAFIAAAAAALGGIHRDENETPGARALAR
ncbi:MAG: hypothetical protein U1E56_09080 [Bauldia sp.]